MYATLKKLLQAVIELSPYRIVRLTSKNRFVAIEEMILQLRDRGYEPRRIVDGGANVGDFARFCRKVFPTARIDLIEPQPACHAVLEDLARAPGFTLHPVGIGKADGELVLAIDPQGVTTGAHILDVNCVGDTKPTVKIPVSTLDSILEEVPASDRTFLKLDLQGWEMESLKGAELVLGRIEVILCEVSFFAQAYEPPIDKLIQFLAGHGFALYDIASISARGRDNRARQGDFIFVRQNSPLFMDTAWA